MMSAHIAFILRQICKKLSKMVPLAAILMRSTVQLKNLESNLGASQFKLGN